MPVMLWLRAKARASRIVVPRGRRRGAGRRRRLDDGSGDHERGSGRVGALAFLQTAGVVLDLVAENLETVVEDFELRLVLFLPRLEVGDLLLLKSHLLLQGLHLPGFGRAAAKEQEQPRPGKKKALTPHRLTPSPCR